MTANDQMMGILKLEIKTSIVIYQIKLHKLKRIPFIYLLNLFDIYN